MTFGGLATRYPEAGGIYVYLREAYGPRVGFLYGWLSMLVTDPGLTAFLGVGLANYAVHIVPLSDWGSTGRGGRGDRRAGRGQHARAPRSARGSSAPWPA